jgi:hypothetical protein
MTRSQMAFIRVHRDGVVVAGAQSHLVRTGPHRQRPGDDPQPLVVPGVQVQRRLLAGWRAGLDEVMAAVGLGRRGQDGGAQQLAPTNSRSCRSDVAG